MEGLIASQANILNCYLNICRITYKTARIILKLKVVKKCTEASRRFYARVLDVPI